MKIELTMSQATQDNFPQILQYDIDYCQKQIAEFAAEVVKEPARTFSWASQMLTHAANLELYQSALAQLKEGMTLEQLAELLADKVIYAARYPQRSTSPMSNIMEQERLSAMASLLKKMSDK